MTSQSNKVLEYTQKLCEVLRTNYQSYAIQNHRNAIEMNGIVDESYISWHREQIDKLCEGEGLYEYYIDTLRKYYKIVMKTPEGQRSAHLFVDKETGDCYKAASWKSASKGVRYNLLDDKSRQEIYERADWFGSYTYR